MNYYDNNTIKELIDRKSIRVFTGEKIPNEIKEAILIASVNAPTAGNQQLYSIIDVTDQELKNKLAITCDNQPFIAKADLVLIFCADALKYIDAFKDANCNVREAGVGDIMLACCDAMCASQNAVTAAWALGIGSCYIGDILENREIHKEILNLPDHVLPVTMVVFGYPTDQQLDRKKPSRADLKYVVSENKYNRLQGEELREFIGQKFGRDDYENKMQRICDFKYNSSFSKELNRSVLKYLEEFKYK